MNSILIIDDDEDVGEALLTFLRDQGYSVRLAASGLQGLAFAQEETPQIILLDWQMPQMGGQEVLIQLSALEALKSVPVILMSANIDNIPSAILKSRSHLGKPFDVSTLTALVAKELAQG